MKRYLLIACLIITADLIMAQRYTSGDNFPYVNPTPGQITIMANSPIPNWNEPTAKDFQQVVDCGFNLATAQGSVDGIKKIFSAAGDLNLKFLIYNVQLIDSKVRKIYLEAFNNDPHLGGWHMRDEPPYEIWGNLSKEYKAFCKEDTSHLVYVNLVGSISEKFTGPAKTINEYINSFQKIFTPQMFSYDYYPIIIMKGKLNVMYDQFYSDLENYSSISKQTERPFWAYCESMAYSTPSISRPAATEAYLRFEAYNALAYGAQGIVYWAYSLRKPSGDENYQSALVDLTGKKSKAWSAAKKVNTEIKKYNNVFYQCDVKEVRHTGDRIYKDTKKLSGAFGPFNMVRSGEAGVVVSRIENNGDNYIVVVNRDVFNKQKVTLELSANKKVVLMTSKGKQYSGLTDITLTLDKADWAIFKEI